MDGVLKTIVIEFITTSWVIIDDLIFFRARIFRSIGVVVNMFINNMSVYWTNVFYFVAKFFFNAVGNNWLHDWAVLVLLAAIIHWSVKVFFKHFSFPLI